MATPEPHKFFYTAGAYNRKAAPFSHDAATRLQVGDWVLEYTPPPSLMNPRGLKTESEADCIVTVPQFNRVARDARFRREQLRDFRVLGRVTRVQLLGFGWPCVQDIDTECARAGEATVRLEQENALHIDGNEF